MSVCDHIHEALAELQICEETAAGSRITTHCLYPSFDPVSVYIVGYGEGFKVHDDRGAFKSAWSHGRDERAIRTALLKSAAKFRATVMEDTIFAEALSKDWLLPAILSVANASSMAAHSAVEKFAASAEENLNGRIENIIRSTIPLHHINKDFDFIGASGKHHKFAFAVLGSHKTILIDSVVPHHVSISSKYTSFSDAKMESSSIDRFAVYDRILEPVDRSLIEQVADLVPIKSLELGLIRSIGQIKLT